jgi:iron complex transport system ATP-binding protein
MQKQCPLLEFKQVITHEGGHSFGPFNFSLAVGERMAVLGPSGAGKTTLLKLMARDQQAHRGEVFFGARKLVDWSLVDLSRYRAVLPQNHEVAFALPTDLVISLGRVARLESSTRQRHIVRLAAEWAYASHLLGRRFNTLSGGEKARVQLARVFAQLWDVEQGILLMDEPLAALDPALQLQLMDALLGFAHQGCHAVVAVLHDINQALAHFERLIFIKEGKIFEDFYRTNNVIPKLENLYGIGFSDLSNKHGDRFVMPELGRKYFSE